MLEIKGLTGGYINIPVLKDISFTVEKGELNWFEWCWKVYNNQ